MKAWLKLANHKFYTPLLAAFYISIFSRNFFDTLEFQKVHNLQEKSTSFSTKNSEKSYRR